MVVDYLEDGEDCLGAWSAGDYVYSIECMDMGVEDPACICSQAVGTVCAPTSADGAVACSAAGQCCGFPTSGTDDDLHDAGSICEGAYTVGSTLYYMVCADLGETDAWCYCEELEV